MNDAKRARAIGELTPDGLPVPRFQRALLFGGAAALLAAAVWGLAASHARIESKWIAWAIGGFVGFAVVLGGGHGQRLALVAAALTALAIGTGVRSGYHGAVREAAEQHVAQWSSTAMWADLQRDAADWKTLGPAPNDEQVVAFASSHGYDTTGAAAFRTDHEPRLVWLAAGDRSFTEWIGFEVDRAAVQIESDFSFFDYLAQRSPFGYALATLLALSTAYGLVMRRAFELRAAARDSARRKALGAERAAAYASRRRQP